MCGIRFMIAGVFMLAFCGLRGRKIRYRPSQLAQMAVVGVLLLVGGNLTLAYAETHVGSGLAALIIAVTPLWFLVLDSLLLGDHHIALRGKIGLGTGRCRPAGIVVARSLVYHRLGTSSVLGFHQLAGRIVQLGAGFGAGQEMEVPRHRSLLSHRLADDCGGSGKLSGRICPGRPARAVWTARGIGAMLYLVVFGSWVGYTAYIWLLNHVPTSKVSTYAYVNPVVAVFLGWLVLHERVSGYILAGSAIVVASVALVTSAQVTAKTAMKKCLPWRRWETSR